MAAERKVPLDEGLEAGGGHGSSALSRPMREESPAAKITPHWPRVRGIRSFGCRGDAGATKAKIALRATRAKDGGHSGLRCGDCGEGAGGSPAQPPAGRRRYARSVMAQVSAQGSRARTWARAVCRRRYVNMGSFTISSCGTDSTGWPALRQARRPPEITNTLNPSFCSRCATRALVASRAQVQ